MLTSLAGKVAVVTGGASGIGAVLVDCLLAEGASVAIADIEPGPLDAAARRYSDAPVITVPTDVSDPAAMDALADRVVAEFGTVHLVCNNAGVAASGTTWNVDVDTWRWVFGVNLGGVVNGIRAFVPILRAQDEGHVVNTASIAGLFTGPSMAPYSASKAAVVATSEALWKELHAEGANVGVSVVCPGGVQTNFSTSARNRPRVDDRDPEPPTDIAAPASEAVKATQAQFIAPEAVAAQIIDAIHTDRFWVLTHPHRSWAITRRAEQIVGGVNPDPGYPT